MSDEAPSERFQNFVKNYRKESGIMEYREKIQKMTVTGERSLVIHFDDLIKFDPELAKTILEKPEKTLKELDQALRRIIESEDPEFAERVENFHVRFSNLPEEHHIPLRKIRSQHIGRLIMVSGILTRASEVKPKIVEAIFVCQRCGEVMPVKQPDTKINQPSECFNPACRRKGPFKLIIEESKFIDWQKIRIQEKPEELPPGQLPRSLDAILIDDIVDIARPGDRITLTGILHSTPETTPRGGSLVTFRSFLEVNNVDISEVELETVEITEEDERKIKELAEDPFVHQKIIRSIAPSIYGMENIKEAIALLLFGGQPKVMEDGVKIRGEANILIVGDPGTAKSQLLQYVARIAPRGLYTSGKGTTAAGLTAAVLRDPDTGTMILEAGALVLADRGVACVDEMDKMREQDRVAIHEAMEQGTVSIAKAGIVATLNARTAILAAANPALGRWNPYKSVAENFKLPATILSRFDLIFVLVDRPREEHDKLMTDHILALHRSQTVDKTPPIPPDLLKKYFIYARKNVHPKLSQEAAEKLRKFYLEMRKMGEQPEAPVPITARQLEALVRLSEARARMALHEEVSAEDAEAVIRLMQFSLRQVGRDEQGLFDIDSIYVGVTKSQRDKMEAILEIIKKLEEQSGAPVPVDVVIESAAMENIDAAFVNRALTQLKNDGILFEPKPGFLKRV
ncbi:MAG: minichromosome maintenance protein MCM [Candidatus Jordarchaeaceae archaeon]